MGIFSRASLPELPLPVDPRQEQERRFAELRDELHYVDARIHEIETELNRISNGAADFRQVLIARGEGSGVVHNPTRREVELHSERNALRTRWNKTLHEWSDLKSALHEQ